MNESWVAAFVVMPAIVIVLGWAAVLAHEWAARRERRKSASDSAP